MKRTMPLRDRMDLIVRHSMRGYYLPLVAGLLLAASAFMPWIIMGENRLGGIPDIANLWIFGLGLLAVTLSLLSVITRKNSRHPLLLVGLIAFAILFMAEKLMERSVLNKAWAQSQAHAIVEGGPVVELTKPVMGLGVYLGFSASAVIVLFGLTIVIRRVSTPYIELEDDDF